VQPPRFLVDVMLGRLGRWLRALGFDAHYDQALTDRELVRLADAEGRVLLTRDRHLLRELRPRRALEVVHDDPLLQLRSVVDGLSLAPPRELFTRCLVCNAPLADVGPADAAALLPPKARALPGPVRRCPGCGRVYWPGSHARRMRGALESALPGWLRVPDPPAPPDPSRPPP